MDRRGSRLSRREFVVGAGRWARAAGGVRAAAGAASSAAAGGIPRVGILYAARGATSNQAQFIETLREIGHVDGQNVVIEARVAAGRADLMATYVDELIRLPVDVIVAVGSPATLAARKATDSIPIVQAFGAADLVREGIVASLARPGGNVTGLTEIARNSVPNGWITQAGRPRGSPAPPCSGIPAFRPRCSPGEEIQGAARILGVQVHSMEVRRADELDDSSPPRHVNGPMVSWC